jgi:hypothetical protein
MVALASWLLLPLLQMRLATAILVFSFFVPTLCDLGIALAAPAHTCKQHQSQNQPSEDNQMRACCLLATLDRPILKEQAQSDRHALVLAVEPIALPLSALDVATGHHWFFGQTRSDYSPPPLFLLNTAFLI